MLAHLEKYGVLRAIHPDFYWPYPPDSPTVPAEDRPMSPEERRDTMLALLGSEYATEPEEAAALARQFGLSADMARLLRDTARLATLWPSLGEPRLTRSEVYQMLCDLDPGALQAFGRFEPLSRDTVAWQNLNDYLARLRFIKPEVNGEYLKRIGVPPGPAYKELLRALLEAKLDGQVNTREDEERFLKERFEREKGAG
jgi:tRNA nucleotidyltransferase (CCA-adding enzyme)